MQNDRGQGQRAKRHTISLLTASSIVVANMVGTGVFTSLGFQIADLPTGFSIMAVWAIGGVFALCGALSYAELAAALPRSGGEYHFLRAIYHPAAGFVAGWISATVGFAAPVAIAAKPFGTYLAAIFPGSNALFLSIALVWLATAALLRDLQLGSVFQNASTLLKLALIAVIIVAGCHAHGGTDISFLPTRGDGKLILSASFAVSLYWVMFAYSGWNASTYIVGELRRPERNVVYSVGLGTAVVIALYLGLNAVFLRTTPASEMIGKEQVALIAGRHIFGRSGGNLMALFICASLVSTVSAMMWIGPRVAATMGQDFRALRWLAWESRRGIPTVAILFQFAIVNMLLVTATFQQVVSYVQFSLTLSSAAAVLGVVVLRWRKPDLPRPYRTWGYPVTPLIFLAISGWMLWHLLAEKATRAPSLWGLTTVGAGLLVYLWVAPTARSRSEVLPRQ